MCWRSFPKRLGDLTRIGYGGWTWRKQGRVLGAPNLPAPLLTPSEVDFDPLFAQELFDDPEGEAAPGFLTFKCVDLARHRLLRISR